MSSSDKVVDFQAFKDKKYQERRKKIQELTGMVGEPIDPESLKENYFFFEEKDIS